MLTLTKRQQHKRLAFEKLDVLVAELRAADLDDGYIAFHLDGRACALRDAPTIARRRKGERKRRRVIAAEKSAEKRAAAGRCAKTQATFRAVLRCIKPAGHDLGCSMFEDKA